MGAHGMRLHRPMQLAVVISISSSGPERPDAHGLNIRVPVQLRVGISISSSEPERMDAPHGRYNRPN
jgi:hypothetical protein